MQLMSNAKSDKLRGGFYTPFEIVQFMMSWVKDKTGINSVLEPSCGDGNFLEQLAEIDGLTVTGIEFDEDEYLKSLNRSPKNFHILNEDFHKYCNSTKQKFDLVIGNPPYIRYQYFDRVQQQEAIKIFESAKIKYSKLMNAWVSFVVGSTLLLNKKGKIAFVLPAEILQVGYAKPLRKFLINNFKKITIITFKKLVFPDIQQEVVLLFCDKVGKGMSKIDHHELEDIHSLSGFETKTLSRPTKKIQIADTKWTHYFLSKKEIQFLHEIRSSDNIKSLGDYCKIEVGITTGANPFFTVTKATVDEYDLHEYAFPLVGRSVQVPSCILTQQDWETNVEKGARAFFLYFPSRKMLNKGAESYITDAEQNQKYHKGYKCRIRDEWHIVPSARISGGLFIRRNNIYPKLIENKIGAYTTDTMHRVTIKGSHNLETIVGSYYNSLSLADAELQGRSHGGGVLELMPNESERILIPVIENLNYSKYVDEMLRNKTSILDILGEMNKIILKNGFGFTVREIGLLESIRCKLLGRRMSRGGK